jgi:hypothetical protein
VYNIIVTWSLRGSPLKVRLVPGIVSKVQCPRFQYILVRPGIGERSTLIALHGAPDVAPAHHLAGFLKGLVC